MPRGAITNWLGELETRATDRQFPVKTSIDSRVFHFQLGTEPGVIGKVRISEGKKRDFRDDAGNEYIWHRYNREQEHAASDDPRPVVNITLDVWDADRYDPDTDHFLVLTEEMVTADTYSKGDRKIRVVGNGAYDGPLAKYPDDWEALFAYARQDSVDAGEGPSAVSETDQRVYRVGERYRDARDPEEDEFQTWIRGPLDAGIGATAGIRPLYGEDGPYEGTITALVLVSSDSTSGDQINPWPDEFDLDNGEIRYWGDAKRESPDETVDEDAFQGNQALREVQRYTQDGRRDQYPPILVFRKPESGVVEFCGMCVIDELEVAEFTQMGTPTPNYCCHLTVLDVEAVPVAWLHERSVTGDDMLAPEPWQHWVETGDIPPANQYGQSSTETTGWGSVGLEPTDDTAGTVTTNEQTTVQVSQAFKDQVYETYGECIVTEISHRGLLSVAHICPRAEYPELAEDLGNVVLLTYTHHRAFDLGLWTIDTDGRLRVNPGFSPDDPWLQNTLTLRDGAAISALQEAPLDGTYLQQRNQSLDWISVDSG